MFPWSVLTANLKVRWYRCLLDVWGCHGRSIGFLLLIIGSNNSLICLFADKARPSIHSLLLGEMLHSRVFQLRRVRKAPESGLLSTSTAVRNGNGRNGGLEHEWIIFHNKSSQLNFIFYRGVETTNQWWWWWWWRRRRHTWGDDRKNAFRWWGVMTHKKTHLYIDW